MGCFKIPNLMFVTGNISKVVEARKILSDYNIDSINIELPEIQESPEEIAKEKAKIACQYLGTAVFVEDDSNHFSALGGMPGPYMKDFMKCMKVEDIPKLLESFDNKSCTVVASIGYCEPTKSPVCFQGKIKGKIVYPRGSNGFGWDSIFQPDGYYKTFAEMTDEEKNSISHRKIALEQFKEYLEGLSRFR